MSEGPIGKQGNSKMHTPFLSASPPLCPLDSYLYCYVLPLVSAEWLLSLTFLPSQIYALHSSNCSNCLGKGWKTEGTAPSLPSMLAVIDILVENSKSRLSFQTKVIVEGESNDLQWKLPKAAKVKWNKLPMKRANVEYKTNELLGKQWCNFQLPA